MNPRRNFILRLRSCTSLSKCLQTPDHVPITKSLERLLLLKFSIPIHLDRPSDIHSLDYLQSFVAHRTFVYFRQLLAFTAVLVPCPILSFAGIWVNPWNTNPIHSSSYTPQSCCTLHVYLLCLSLLTFRPFFLISSLRLHLKIASVLHQFRRRCATPICYP